MRVHTNLLASSVLALATAAGPAWGQSSDTAEQVVVTGTRGQPRTVMDSPVPVDVISAAEIQSAPSVDLNNILNTVVPSFSVSRQANSTSGTFIRPISIRGLPEDAVLMLVNGKRRHLSASVSVGGNGAQGPDAAVIPAMALDNVQVLRDGAAAQYGSDAIAGVVNFVLKSADHGFAVDIQAGQTSEGDGQSATAAFNFGIPIPIINKGFLNFTGEYSRQGNTIRVGDYVSAPFTCSTWAATHPVFAALIDGDCRLQKTGQPSTEAFRTFLNGGVPITDHSDLYFFANFALSKGDAYGSYRYPANGQDVNGPTIRLEDGSTFSFTDMFPAGWNPIFSGQVRDISGTVGYRGDWNFGGGQKLMYDFSARYGFSEIAYTVRDTVNPSLGPSTPHSFKPYTDRNKELSLNADFSYTLPVSWFATPLIISAGTEYRRVGYRILGGEDTGDPLSIEAGPYASKDPWGFCNGSVPTAKGAALPVSAGLNCANPNDPVYQVLPAGSNSITGLPPQSTGRWYDKAMSFYGELDTNVFDFWEVDLATRFENFNSFGTNTSEKLATRIVLTDWLSLRGSAGTGFHAPSPGMLHQTNIQLQTVNGVPQQAGLFPPDNIVATFLGAKPLTPEKAVNFSAGLAATPLEDVSVTLDGYLIRMFDKIYATSSITVTPAIAAQIAAAGIPGANTIRSVNFFQNAFDSNTAGLDLVTTYDHGWEDTLWDMNQDTKFSFSANWNRYVISHVNIPNLFNAASKFNFEHAQPSWRGVATITHDLGPFEAMFRANIFGSYVVSTTAAPILYQNVHTDVQFDAEASWKMDDHYRIALGALNVFNKYPEINTINASRGLIYRDGPESWQGSYYYLRLQYKM